MGWKMVMKFLNVSDTISRKSQTEVYVIYQEDEQ